MGVRIIFSVCAASCRGWGVCVFSLFCGRWRWRLGVRVFLLTLVIMTILTVLTTLTTLMTLTRRLCSRRRVSCVSTLLTTLALTSLTTRLTRRHSRRHSRRRVSCRARRRVSCRARRRVSCSVFRHIVTAFSRRARHFSTSVGWHWIFFRCTVLSSSSTIKTAVVRAFLVILSSIICCACRGDIITF